MVQAAQKPQTLLSSRIPRDTEHERYHPELEEELKECLFCLRRNEMMFDLETDRPHRAAHLRAAGPSGPLPLLTFPRPGTRAPHDLAEVSATGLMFLMGNQPKITAAPDGTPAGGCFCLK